MKKYFLTSVLIMALLVLINISQVWAEEITPYGPPINMPTGSMPNLPPNFEPGQIPEGQPKMGPSDEQMQKMNEQRLTMMKKGASQMVKGMTNVKKQITKFEKQVTIPTELKEAVTNIDTIIDTIKNSSDADEVQGAMDKFQDSIEVIQEWMPKLPKLAVLPKLLKQGEKEIAKAEKAYAADQKKIAKYGGDFASILTEFRTAIDNQKQVLTEIKDQIKTDPEEALDRIQDDFFGNLDNLWENEKVIQMALGLKKGLVQIGKDITQSEKLIAKLKKQKIDVTELETIIAQAKIQYEELKQMNNKKETIENMIDQIDLLLETKQAFQDKVEDLTGNYEYKAEMPKEQKFQMNIPAGFMMDK